MKASIYTTYGSPEVLSLQEVPKPIPKEEEVLIKIHARTVNRTDCAMLRAKPFIMRFLTGLFQPKNPILGTDFAGQIEAIGTKVTTFKVGDKVFGFEDEGLSSHAEYLSFSVHKGMAVIPHNISYQQAAASIEGAHYAYNTINKINIKKGQQVLVNGATGAIGSATVQLFVHFGAVVTAVGNTKNMELMKSMGATTVIDYEKEDFTNTKQQFDYICDTVGKSSFRKCRPLLKKGGIYTSSELGWMAQNIFYALFTPLFGGKKVIFPIPRDIKSSVLLIQQLLAEGKFKPVIDKVYSLERIAEAFEYVETGQKTGNVIIS